VILTSELVRAARALLRMEQINLATAAGLSISTIKRLEAKPGPLNAHGLTEEAIQRALEDAGVEFTNGDRPGVRMRAVKRGRTK
jgi:hypothetical protein